MYHQAHGRFAYPVAPDTLRVVLRAGKGDLRQVTVVFEDRYQAAERQAQVMERAAADELFDYFQADITLATSRFVYAFLVDDGVQRTFMTEKGFFDDPPKDSGFQYPYIAPQDLWEPPRWAQGAVVYQIFPERFANGDTSNDPKQVEDWDALPTRESMKGGDLQGIIDGLDYLEKLGVEVLYLTPIFESPSNHKYNITDYYRIDPHFGDLETCRELVQKCHQRDIRILFDAVFNHCGYEFFAFQDVIKNGRKSQYWDWFRIEGDTVKTDPPNYETFADGIWTMPKLMTQNPEVREYCLNVAEYWIQECDIDGWRLDVANEVDHDFWRAFRKRVKAAKPDALIVGEVWHEASAWVQGDQFDSVMNYPFADACTAFFAEQSILAETFAHRLAKVQMNHQQVVNRAMYNLFGSHDTPRFLTLAGERREKLKLAAGFALTYEGAPMIYYGDEVGMVGDNDPDCRRGMIWDNKRQDRQLLQWYMDLIALRRSQPLLKTGHCRIAAADSIRNLIAFVRYDDSQQLLVVFNNSDQEQSLDLGEISWPLQPPKAVRDLLTGRKASESVSLQPNQMMVLQ